MRQLLLIAFLAAPASASSVTPEMDELLLEGIDALYRMDFEGKVERAAAVAEKWLKTHPRDPQALLVLGSAHGVAARLAIVRRDWLGAFGHGRKAMRSVRAALKADPELWDAYLGTGMFDYYVDTIPRFAGWLAKVMLAERRLWDFKSYLKPCLSRPCVDGLPGHFSPPY